MGRSGYVDDWDGEGPSPELYRQAVKNAIKGKRGQIFLRTLAAEMDKMPEKKLISNKLINKEGECCALGVVLKARNIDIGDIYAENTDIIGKLTNIAQSMVSEIAFENDNDFGFHEETPSQRWTRMRQ